MLGIVLTHRLQKAGIKLEQWYAMILKWLMLCKTIIAHGINLMILTAQHTCNLLAQILLKLEPLVARFLTTVVALIKVGYTHVRHLLGVIGQQLLTIARKIHQRVSQLLNTGH